MVKCIHKFPREFTGDYRDQTSGFNSRHTSSRRVADATRCELVNRRRKLGTDVCAMHYGALETRGYIICVPLDSNPRTKNSQL